MAHIRPKPEKFVICNRQRTVANVLKCDKAYSPLGHPILSSIYPIKRYNPSFFYFNVFLLFSAPNINACAPSQLQC